MSWAVSGGCEVGRSGDRGLRERCLGEVVRDRLGTGLGCLLPDSWRRLECLVGVGDGDRSRAGRVLCRCGLAVAVFWRFFGRVMVPKREVKVRLMECF